MKKIAVIVAVLAGIAAIAAAIAVICSYCRRSDDYCSIEIPFGHN